MPFTTVVCNCNRNRNCKIVTEVASIVPVGPISATRLRSHLFALIVLTLDTSNKDVVMELHFEEYEGCELSGDAVYTNE